MRHGWRLTGITAACLFAATLASAEPVNLVGGVLIYERANIGVLDQLVLTHGSLSGYFGDFGSEGWTPAYACFPCTAGARIDSSVSESFTKPGPGHEFVGVGGRLTWQGATYGLTALSFTIDSQPVTVPGGSTFRTTEPAQFVLRGLATGRTADGASQIGLGLLGYGSVVMNFLPDGSWFSTHFRFQDPAAVPEPGTWLLVGSCAVGALRRWRRG